MPEIVGFYIISRKGFGRPATNRTVPEPAEGNMIYMRCRAEINRNAFHTDFKN